MYITVQKFGVGKIKKKGFEKSFLFNAAFIWQKNTVKTVILWNII